MELRYDLHLHSNLSPCADDDMTPYNLVHMAQLLDLDVVALTDHNTCGNCRSAVEVGRSAGITVVPGMELCTAEEIHVICLFPDCDRADGFWNHVKPTLPPVQNRPDVFGRQLYLDERDGILGEEPLLLVTASSIGIEGLPPLVEQWDGFCYPAHIDRSSYSILSSLGTIDPAMGFSWVEVTPQGDLEELTRLHPALAYMGILRSSDAHRLEDMREVADTICLPENTPWALIRYLRNL